MMSNYGSIRGSISPIVPVPIEIKVYLKWWQKYGYALGHFYNDMCAGIWFSYTLMYFKFVREVSGGTAGIYILIGQIVDAIATPLIGIVSDCWLTKIQWHFIGVLLVTVSFPILFANLNISYVCMDLFNIGLIVSFQCGWPCVQVSHLAIIPEISENQTERSELTGCRFTVSMIANLCVYILTWLCLHNENSKNIQPKDSFKFREITITLSGLGIFATLLFYFILRTIKISAEPDCEIEENTALLANNEISESNADTLIPTDCRVILSNPFLYLNSLLYVSARLYQVLAIVYIPMWLKEELNQASNFNSLLSDIRQNEVSEMQLIALVPLMFFITSFLTSFVMKQTRLNEKHCINYILGSIFSDIACTLTILLHKIEYLNSFDYKYYIIAACYGAGSSFTMISSMSKVAIMFQRDNVKHSGLIYSIVTFSDKVLTGVIIAMVEQYKCIECSYYYRYALGYGCAIATSFGLIFLIIIALCKH